MIRRRISARKTRNGITASPATAISGSMAKSTTSIPAEGEHLGDEDRHPGHQRVLHPGDVPGETGDEVAGALAVVEAEREPEQPGVRRSPDVGADALGAHADEAVGEVAEHRAHRAEQHHREGGDPGEGERAPRLHRGEDGERSLDRAPADRVVDGEEQRPGPGEIDRGLGEGDHRSRSRGGPRYGQRKRASSTRMARPSVIGPARPHIVEQPCPRGEAGGQQQHQPGEDGGGHHPVVPARGRARRRRVHHRGRARGRGGGGGRARRRDGHHGGRVRGRRRRAAAAAGGAGAGAGGGAVRGVAVATGAGAGVAGGGAGVGCADAAGVAGAGVAGAGVARGDGAGLGPWRWCDRGWVAAGWAVAVVWASAVACASVIATNAISSDRTACADDSTRSDRTSSLHLQQSRHPRCPHRGTTARPTRWRLYRPLSSPPPSPSSVGGGDAKHTRSATPAHKTNLKLHIRSRD